jgi:soluble lytic murein transglycosylase-like protein
MLRIIAASGLMASAVAVSAQVIEIDADGSQRTFDQPMRFGADSAIPIAAEAEPVPTPTSSPSALAGAARAHGLAAGLLEAVAWQESRGRQSAVSPRGAIGVMQLMPGTAAELGVNPYDARSNIEGGARYLRRQLDRFGSVPLALAAYNAGPGAVLRYGGIPPYRETRGYVAAIMGRLQAGDRRFADIGRPFPLPPALMPPLLMEVPSS